jgi:hypothetical protein
MGNDAIVVEKMGLFLRKVPLLEYGSPGETLSKTFSPTISAFC